LYFVGKLKIIGGAENNEHENARHETIAQKRPTFKAGS